MRGNRLGRPSQFRQLVESFPDAIVIVDPAGRIRYANAHAACLFGYERAHLRGEYVQGLVPDQPLLPGRGRGRQVRRSRLELVARRRDSSQFPAAVDVIPVRTLLGPSAVLIIRDMTDAQRARFVFERGMEVLESEDRDRQALFGRLVRAQEEERRRIAADIHDDTIQVVTAAYLGLKQLRLRLRLEDPAQLEILGKLEENLQLALGRLRQLIFDLRPSRLEDGDLAAAVRTYLKRMAAEAGIRYQFCDKLGVTAPVNQSVLIYRAAQEALTNVREHARAATVQVELLGVRDGCLVRIVDDGVGYDSADIEGRPGHLGLTLIRERSQLSGGWYRIESAPGTGTTVEFRVPFNGRC
jgi:PAS domain S-box-containing protein